MDEALQQHSHFFDLLSELLLFFGIAGLLVPLLQRLRLSPVLGYLVCGIVIGPYALGSLSGGESAAWLSYVTITDRSAVELLGELGVVALLFMIGLELSFERLKELRRYILGLGSAQIALTGIVICLIALLFDNTLEAAILIGASLALSSTAIVMQLLDERHLLSRPVGRLSFSILLMQDLAVVPILVLVGTFAASETQSVPAALASTALIAVLAVSVIYVTGKKLLRPLMNALSFTDNPEWLAAFTLFIVAGAAMVTHMAGLSAALGAFLAGLLIAETEFRHEVGVITEPLKNILLGIFFLSIGMMIDPAEIAQAPFWIAASVAGIFLVKGTILFPLCRLFKVPAERAAQVAVILAQPGEFALLVLSAAFAAGLMPQEDSQFFLLVTALSMLVTPLLMKAAPVAGRWLRKEGVLKDSEQPAEERRVVLVGFGRIGRLLGMVLEKEGVPYIAIDRDSARSQAMREKGYPVLYGDARNIRSWRHLKVREARAVVVTVDDHDASCGIIAALRQQAPFLPLVVRAHDTSTMDALYDKGATYVVPETLESSLQMAHFLLSALGREDEHIEGFLDQFRNQATMEQKS